MWYIFAVLVFPYGNATYGGPVVIDGFKSEQACLAHIATFRGSVPDVIPQELWAAIKPRVEVIKCIEKKV